MSSTKSNRGGRRAGAGRPKGSSNPASLVGKKVYLTREQWEYLARWDATGTPGHQVGSLIDRAVSFWPAGPRTNPRMGPELLAIYSEEGK